MSEMDLLDMFAENLKYVMNDENVSAAELARLTGLKKSTISRYLKAQRMPSMKAFLNICRALNCDYYDILPPMTSYIK